jgi:raffinose/stachyose/melibiose transport system substrate-binding protein
LTTYEVQVTIQGKWNKFSFRNIYSQKQLENAYFDKEKLMKTIRRMIIPVLLLMLIVSTSVVTAQDAPEELHVWVLTFSGASVTEAWDSVVADFEAANPDIDIVLEQRSTDAHKDALRVAAGTDAAPDIYFMWAGLGLGGEFVNLGVSEPLDADYEALGWNDRFLPSSLSKTEYDGVHQGVPYTVHGMVVYYRKDAFEQAGITEEPQTYDELIAANDKLVAAGIQPFSFGGSVNWHVMRLLDSLLETTCGAETHDALKAMTVSWTEEPCATEAFNELARWNEAGYLGQNYMGINNDDSALLVYTGQAAMFLEGDWMVQAIEDQGEDLANYGMFPFPTGTERLYAFAENLYVTAGTPHREAAVRFLDYLTSTDVQQANLGVFGAISVNGEVEYPADRRPLDVEWSDIFNTYQGVYEPGDQAFPLAVNTEYWRIQNGVLTGEIAPNDAATQLQTFIDNFKADNG